MRNAAVIGVVVVMAVAAAGCSRDGNATQSATKPAVAVETSEARTASIVQAVEITGTLAPKRSAEIKSELTGVVTELAVSDWAPVARGALLARLDSRDAEATLATARANVLQAKVGEDRARRELERAERLKQVGLITQQQLDDARTALEAAAAGSEAARAQLTLAEAHLTKTAIRAPFAGVVEYRGVDVGDRVENMGGGAMFRIVDPTVLELVAAVPSSRMAGLAVGQTLEFSTDADPGRTFTGTVSFINPSVDPTSRAVRLVVDVDNRDRELRGGMFAKGRIRTGERADVLQVPRAALLSWDVEQSSAEVLVISGQTAERRTIRTGQATGDAVEVVHGLAAGDHVITRGAFNVNPGDVVTVTTGQGA